MYLFLCYPKCSTCKKAQKYLNNNNISYNFRDIMIDNPTVAELTKWLEISKLPIEKFFNSSGIMYRELNLKDKLPTLSLQEKIELLSTSGRLVKRPLLINENTVLIGFNENNYKDLK